MKKITIIFLFLHSQLNAQVFNWTRNFNYSDNSYGTNLSIDSNGNTFTSIFSSTNVDHGINTTWGFIKKFDDNGSLTWSGSSDQTSCIDTNSNGSIIVSHYNKIVIYDNVTGNILRKDTFSFNNGHTRIEKMSCNKSDTYIAGTIWKDTASFGSCTISISSNSLCIFVTKFDSTGNCLWAKQSTTGHAELKAIATDLNGNVYVGGSFINSMTLEGITISANGFEENGFIAKFDTNGNLMWLYNVDGEWVSALKCDNSGNLYALGKYLEPMYLGSFYLDKNGYWNDTFFAKFDPNGQCLWAKKLGSNGSDEGTAIWVDNNSNAYITGYVGAPGNLDNLPLNRSGVYIAKFDSNGNGIWAVQPTGAGGAIGYGIAGDNKGHIAVTGGFAGTLTFGNQTITGSNEMFVTMLTDTTFITSNKDIITLQNDITIFPNPSVDQVSIIYKSTQSINSLKLNVKNLLGQTIYSTKAFNLSNEYKKTIDLSNENKGIYFIEVIADEERVVRKVVLD